MGYHWFWRGGDLWPWRGGLPFPILGNTDREWLESARVLWKVVKCGRKWVF